MAGKKEMIRVQVSVPRDSKKSFGVLVDLIFDENGRNISGSRLEWFPKSVCSIETIEPENRKTDLPTYFLTARK
jgi:hypothetical protein